MKFGIIVGSMQATSNSAKVGRYLEKQAVDLGHSVYILDLGKSPMPLWGGPAGDIDPEWPTRLESIKTALADCSGFVIISPEYHGMVPAALKNFFLYVGSDVLGHKPAYLVGVSAGTGGAYPIAELRMTSSKNNRLCYTPEHCIVRHADQVLNEDGSNDVQGDALISKRLDYGLAILIEYARALSGVRESGVIDHQNFGNGM